VVKWDEESSIENEFKLIKYKDFSTDEEIDK